MRNNKQSDGEYIMSDTRMTKAELVAQIATATDFTKKDVTALLASLATVVEAEVKAGRIVVVPGLVKLSASVKPPTKERVGTNPFTGKPMVIKAREESKRVKASAVPALKASLKA